ncbi:Prolactin [Fukomys damarensis]|uniref:Prolactin n=1 Tax=Fukomys damarensis TaxID=885580 RepID=A0A091DAY4_FUKDA|nr:Prolactin [Fukomys damarensis]
MTLVVDDITKQACSLEAISENKGEKPACTFEASVYLKSASLTTAVMVDIGLIATGFQNKQTELGESLEHPGSLVMLLAVWSLLLRQDVAAQSHIAYGTGYHIYLPSELDGDISVANYIHDLSSDIYNKFVALYSWGTDFSVLHSTKCHTDSISMPENNEQALKIQVAPQIRNYGDAAVWTQLPSLQSADEEKLLHTFYHLCYCLRRDTHKVESFLKVLKSQVAYHGNC